MLISVILIDISVARMGIFEFPTVICFLFSLLEFRHPAMPIYQSLEWRICCSFEYLLFYIEILLMLRVGSFALGILRSFWTKLTNDILVKMLWLLFLLRHVIIFDWGIFIRVTAVFDARSECLAKSVL